MGTMKIPKTALQAAQRQRRYVHFDLPLSRSAVRALVLDAARVAAHPFYPFIRHDIVRPKIKRTGKGQFLRRLKVREIRYAAHADAAIYAYYSHLLSQRYETRLAMAGLGAWVIAFRSLSKSNTDFATEAFTWIASNSPCVAMGFDVKDFFGSIDHAELKRAWAALLDTETLPADHFSVYRSITRHSSVELIAARRALHITRSALKKRDRMCSPSDFRKIVRGGGLIDVNGLGRGIPQGSPISALLSNLYMFEFDVRIATEVENRGGYYRRYCDDILIVADAKWSTDLEALVAAELQRIGLVMQISKTQMRKFSPAADKPLQYLGLTYDGDRILLRPSGIARHYSKMRRGILSHKLSPRLIKGRSLLQVRRRRLLRAYTEHAPATVRSFMSYVRSASKKSGSAVVLRQLKGHRRRFRKLLKS